MSEWDALGNANERLLEARRNGSAEDIARAEAEVRRAKEGLGWLFMLLLNCAQATDGSYLWKLLARFEFVDTDAQARIERLEREVQELKRERWERERQTFPRLATSDEDDYF